MVTYDISIGRRHRKWVAIVVPEYVTFLEQGTNRRFAVSLITNKLAFEQGPVEIEIQDLVYNAFVDLAQKDESAQDIIENVMRGTKREALKQREKEIFSELRKLQKELQMIAVELSNL